MNAYYLLDPRFISFSPTLQRVYLDVPTQARTSGKLKQLVARLATSFSRSLRRSATRRALYALDDSLLRDIGIERTQIGAVVDSMLNETPLSAVTPMPTASVHRLVTKKSESAPRADSLSTAA